MYYIQTSCYYGKYQAGAFNTANESKAIKMAKELHKNRKLRGFKWQVVEQEEYQDLKNLDPDYPILN